MITGRFAPTPSGPLHLGSLVAALGSYCAARSAQGQWLMRIEDVDTPRVVKGASDDILGTLEAFGFEWDGAVTYQSQRFAHYESVIQQLLDDGHLFACECSRKKLHAEAHRRGPLGLIYPGHCRDKHLDPNYHSLRLQLASAGVWSFTDQRYGEYALDLSQQVGDVVLKRVDGVYAYHLAVTVDDADQGVNQIVRGYDLFELTPLHLFLNSLLGFTHATYLHLPLIKTTEGKKLSKQTGARAVDPANASALLFNCLEFLGQEPDPTLLSARPDEILQAAIEHWNIALIPAL